MLPTIGGGPRVTAITLHESRVADVLRVELAYSTGCPLGPGYPSEVWPFASSFARGFSGVAWLGCCARIADVWVDLLHGVCWEIGNGVYVRFWFDAWVPGVADLFLSLWPQFQRIYYTVGFLI